MNKFTKLLLTGTEEVVVATGTLVAKGSLLIIAAAFLPITLTWLGIKAISSRLRARRGRGAVAEETARPAGNDIPGAGISESANTIFPGTGLSTGAGTEMQVPPAWITFVSGPRAGQSVSLSAGNTIGSSADNDVVVEGDGVALRQARIVFGEGRFALEEVGSMTATLIDGALTAKSALSSGATLHIGDTELMFTQAEPGATVATPTNSFAPAETIMMPPQQTPVLAWLAVIAGPQKGKTYQLRDGNNTVGRASDNDFVIVDPTVSRHHASIKVEDQRFLLLEAGSSSGTSVGGQFLSGKPLAPGGMIHVGHSEMKLVEVDSYQPAVSGSAPGETIVAQPERPTTAVLMVMSGPDAGQSFPLSQHVTLVGRESECDVLLTDEGVSRRHCLVRKNSEGLTVFDLGSHAGTQVDGEALTGHPLTSGETITLGQTDMIVMEIEPRGR